MAADLGRRIGRRDNLKPVYAAGKVGVLVDAAAACDERPGCPSLTPIVEGASLRDIPVYPLGQQAPVRIKRICATPRAEPAALCHATA